MYCGHPSFEEKNDSWANRILTQDNCIDKIPNECPLRFSNLEIVFRYNLKID